MHGNQLIEHRRVFIEAQRSLWIKNKKKLSVPSTQALGSKKKEKVIVSRSLLSSLISMQGFFKHPAVANRPPPPPPLSPLPSHSDIQSLLVCKWVETCCHDTTAALRLIHYSRAGDQEQHHLHIFEEYAKKGATCCHTHCFLIHYKFEFPLNWCSGFLMRHNKGFPRLGEKLPRSSFYIQIFFFPPAKNHHDVSFSSIVVPCSLKAHWLYKPMDVIEWCSWHLHKSCWAFFIPTAFNCHI